MCKKRIVLSLILAMLFVSCKNPLNFKQDAKESQKAYISISANLPGSNARTVLPNVVTDTTTGLTWELTGEMIGSSTSKTFEKSWSDTEDKTAYQQMIYPDADSGILLDVGNWKFTLTVYNTEGKVLEATLGDENNPIQITKDGENKLDFVMQEATGENLANGQIEFTLKFPENVVGQVEATLYEYPTSPNGENTNLDIQTRTDVDGKSYSCVVYENSNDLAPGYYKLNLALQQNIGTEEKPEYETITTYSCLIYVAPGLLSSGSYTLESLAKLYPVTFELNDGYIGEKETLTVTYNKYQKIDLPTPEKRGYSFEGWYDFNGEKIEGDYYLPESVSDDGIILYAKWEEVLVESFELKKRNSDGTEIDLGSSGSASVENEYTKISTTFADGNNIWTYYAYPESNDRFGEDGNYLVSVDLWAAEDTVVAIAAARTDMYFTVSGNEWTHCEFETGYVKAGINNTGLTLGIGLTSEIRIRNLKVNNIETSSNLPTLSFNISDEGIKNYIENTSEEKPKQIILIEKTQNEDNNSINGYKINLNTTGVTLKLRDYATPGKINNVSFNVNQSLSLSTAAIQAYSVDTTLKEDDNKNDKINAWTNLSELKQNNNIYFPALKNSEEDEMVPCVVDGIFSSGTTSTGSITITDFEIKTVEDLKDTDKVFAVKVGEVWNKVQDLSSYEISNISDNTAVQVVLTDNLDTEGNDWDELNWGGDDTTGEGSPNSYYCQFLNYQGISTNGISVTDNGDYCMVSGAETIKLSLTEDFTVQIEETTTGGTTAGGEATSTDPSEQNNGLAYFTKSDENGGNISCLYIYDDVGLGLYRDLVNGTLKSELTFTKNGYIIGSIPPSYTGRVDAYLAENIEITNAWTPIGTSSNSFTSSFDGQGHSITINSCADGEYAGVFGYVGNQSASTTSISNLVVKGPETGITTSAQYAGGIVAYSYGATISNCVNKLKIDASASSTGYLGGIVGYTKKETIISSCANFAELVSTSSIGGIVGFADVENNYSPLSIDKCINIGSIKGSSNGNYVSGILGRTATATTISNCINFGERGCNGGPFPLNHSGVATVTDSGNLTISNCINAGPYANIYNSASIAIAYAVNTNSINSSNLYYNTDNWYYDYYGSQVQGNVEDTCTVRGLSTEDFFDSSKCVLVADENWSCVIDGTRYPLPDILGADENSGVSQSIWEEICEVAKVEESSGGGEEIEGTELNQVTTNSLEEGGTFVLSATDNNIIYVTETIEISSDVTISSKNSSQVVTLERDSSFDEGPMFKVIAGGSLTLSNVTLDGGATFSFSEDDLVNSTVTSDLTGITSSDGPLIYNNGGNVILNENSILQNNWFMYSSTITGGGAVYMDDGTFEMNGATIQNNYANTSTSSGGGAVFLTGGQFTFNSGLISNNYCLGRGGGIFINSTNAKEVVIFEMNGGEIKNNAAGTFGGGLTVYENSKSKGANVQLNSGSINNNYAKTNGGGVYLYMGNSSSEGYVGGCEKDFTICENKVGYSADSTLQGAGMYIYAQKPTENYGFEIKNGAKIYSNSVFTNATSPAIYGLGVYLMSGNVLMSGGSIYNNSASSTVQSYGAGVYTKCDNFTMTGGSIKGNTLSGAAGNEHQGQQIYLNASDGKKMTLNGTDYSATSYMDEDITIN